MDAVMQSTKLSGARLASLVQGWASKYMRVDHAEVERSKGDVGVCKRNEHSPVDLCNISAA